MPEFVDRYIHQVEDRELDEALLQSAGAFHAIADQLEALGDKVYAPGKWTIKDILQHCIDTERILSYRALRIARNDRTPLAGFEEEDYARYTSATERSVVDLLDELAVVRKSSILLFRNFSNEMLLRQGTASGRSLTVLALGFTIAGHVLHHLRIVEERYFPLTR